MNVKVIFRQDAIYRIIKKVHDRSEKCPQCEETFNSTMDLEVHKKSKHHCQCDCFVNDKTRLDELHTHKKTKLEQNNMGVTIVIKKQPVTKMLSSTQNIIVRPLNLMSLNVK